MKGRYRGPSLPFAWIIDRSGDWIIDRSNAWNIDRSGALIIDRSGVWIIYFSIIYEPIYLKFTVYLHTVMVIMQTTFYGDQSLIFELLAFNPIYTGGLELRYIPRGGVSPPPYDLGS